MLFKKSVRGRIVLGQDGAPREMMGRDLCVYLISACGAGCPAGFGAGFPPSTPLLAIWQVRGFPAMLLQARRG